MEYYVQNWEKAFNDTYKLSEQIRDSGFIPDVIVGVARGGWIPARLLADFLHLKQTVNVKIETYQMMGQEELKPDIQQPLSANLEGKKVLLVDDVADSGITLRTTINMIRLQNPNIIKTAVLYYKPHCIIEPDYYSLKTSAWILFSWSLFESIEEFYNNWTEQGMNLKEIKQKLKGIGVPPSIVNSYFDLK